MIQIDKSTLDFLEQLQLHNYRERFHENNDWYQESRKNFITFVESLRDGIAGFDPLVGSLEPKHMIFRINRDIRFSKDKSPYKLNLGASITAGGGKKSPFAGYYFHIQPGNHSFIGGGIYRPENDITAAIRHKLRKDGKQFNTIIEHSEFKKLFERPLGRSLVRPPKGFSKDEANLDLIKMKDWYVLHQLQDKEILKPGFLEGCIEKCKVLSSYNKFFNATISELLE